MPKEGSLSWDVLKRSIPPDETFFNDTLKISLAN
jgi:hypothetical protein